MGLLILLSYSIVKIKLSKTLFSTVNREMRPVNSRFRIQWFLQRKANADLGKNRTNIAAAISRWHTAHPRVSVYYIINLTELYR